MPDGDIRQTECRNPIAAIVLPGWARHAAANNEEVPGYAEAIL
jgi:hypothetical protein